jgi:hypothetical protein
MARRLTVTISKPRRKSSLKPLIGRKSIAIRPPSAENLLSVMRTRKRKEPEHRVVAYVSKRFLDRVKRAAMRRQISVSRYTYEALAALMQRDLLASEGAMLPSLRGRPRQVF